jgi:titin
MLGQTIRQGLISWFPFDKDLKDYSGMSNHGSGQGTVRLSTDRFGRDSSALELRAGSDLMCTSNSFASPQSFSLSLWFNIPVSSTGEHLAGFNRGQCSHNMQWDRVLFIRSDRIGFYVFEGRETEVSAPLALKDGQWHHVSATFLNGLVKLYVDGVLVKDQTIGLAESYTGYWRIGGLSPNDLNNSVQGRIDDFSIHNRPLSATEVQSMFNDRPQFLWSTGATSDTLNVAPTTSTTYRVQMTRGGLTCSDSIAVTVIAAARVPGAPALVSGVAGDASVSVSFVAPADSGTSSITNYAWSVDNGLNWTLRSPASVSSPLQISGLTNGISYPVRIRAVNATGLGAASDSLDMIPKTVPGTPTSLAGTPGYGSVSVSFTAPASTGGSVITNYAFSTDDGSTWTMRSPASVASPISITGLTNGTSYRLRLRAVNAVGQGAVSDAVTATPVGASTLPVLTSITPANRQLTIVYTSPSVATGVRITNYEYSLNNGGSWIARQPVSISSPILITGLTNGQTYSIRIRAVTTTGRTGPSNMMASAPYTIPEYPVNLVTTAGNASVTIGFRPPSSDGGSVITNYQYSLNNGAWTDRTPASSSTPLMITGLTNGVNYSIRIRAVNAAGGGVASWPVSAMPMTTPGAPQGLSAQASHRSATMSFTHPAETGGVSITHYQWSLDGGQTWTVTTQASRSTPMLMQDLVNGKTYQIRVRAINLAGAGPASNVATVMPCTTPDFPTNIRVEPGDRSALMYFTPPTQTGGAPILNYQYSINNGQTWLTRSPASSSSPILFSGLTNGTRYALKIRAVNAAGPGLESWTFTVFARTVTGALKITSLKPGNG